MTDHVTFAAAVTVFHRTNAHCAHHRNSDLFTNNYGNNFTTKHSFNSGVMANKTISQQLENTPFVMLILPKSLFVFVNVITFDSYSQPLRELVNKHVINN